MKRMTGLILLLMAMAGPAVAAVIGETPQQTNGTYGNTMKEMQGSIGRGDQGAVNLHMVSLFQLLAEKPTPPVMTRAEKKAAEDSFADLLRLSDERSATSF